MQLLLARHLWGVDGTWDAVFPRIRASGYGAIETSPPAAAEQAHFQALLEQHDFDYIAQIYTHGASVAAHVESFRAQVAACRPMQPLFINCQSGQDAWSEAQSAAFFAEALQIEADSGIAVAHETHRGRVLYNPWTTTRLLDHFPALRLCADLSHWVCVCERLLDDQEDLLHQVARQCLHIHARVGYEEGPQVPDPRAPEYQRHLAAHERWWQWIWEAQAAQGLAQTTLTPEFGLPGYLHTLGCGNDS